ncbi:hypothetical protein D1AOALGA4SA_2735 [Olavius algarvensis Delta 1 endosymbiont]|nr:hypothetical protein D1AOALGA4SA_2735 [Olavius algarvensis Delta 1 endosymbiont]
MLHKKTKDPKAKLVRFAHNFGMMEYWNNGIIGSGIVE